LKRAYLSSLMRFLDERIREIALKDRAGKEA